MVATIRGGATVSGASVRVTALDISGPPRYSTAPPSSSPSASAWPSAWRWPPPTCRSSSTRPSRTPPSRPPATSPSSPSRSNADAYTLVLSISVAIGIAADGAIAIATVGGSTTARIDGAVVSAGALTVVATTEARSHAKTEGAPAPSSPSPPCCPRPRRRSRRRRALVLGPSSRPPEPSSSRPRGRGHRQDRDDVRRALRRRCRVPRGVGGRSDATDSGAVRALVGDGLDVVAGGAMSVTATSTTLTKATSNAGALAGGAIVVPTAYATHSADTVAAVGADTGVSARRCSCGLAPTRRCGSTSSRSPSASSAAPVPTPRRSRRG